MIEYFPETPGQLHDFLHEKFGIGTYDDVANAGSPWWKERNNNIAKLKAMMRKRRVSERQIAIAAWYAQQHGKPIRYYAELFALVPEAMRSYKTAERVAIRKNVRSEIEDAISEALAAGEQSWVDRLVRADDAAAPGVLREWRERA